MKAFPNVTNQQGMDLRDYFAAKAMQGLMSCTEWNEYVSSEDIADEAYVMADAMMFARRRANESL